MRIYTKEAFAFLDGETRKEAPGPAFVDVPDDIGRERIASGQAFEATPQNTIIEYGDHGEGVVVPMENGKLSASWMARKRTEAEAPTHDDATRGDEREDG